MTKGNWSKREQLRFVRPQRVCKRLRPRTGRFHVQRVGRSETELETEVRGFLQELQSACRS